MLKNIDIAAITRNPNQPRQSFDPVALNDLADSIERNGLKQPITVRPVEGDHPYMVVMGERRFRAHKILQERGVLDAITCHVRKMGDEEMHIDAILENLQRAEVSPIEEAMAYERAVEEYGYSIEKLALTLGISQIWRIRDRLQLLGLTLDNRQLVSIGMISSTQAYHMARLSPNGQHEFLQLIKAGFCNSNKACEAAADGIAAKENQGSMFAETEQKPRASMKSTEDRIDKIGAAVLAMFKNGSFEIDSEIEPSEGMRCAAKLKLLAKNLADMRSEIERAASATAAA